MSCCDDVPEELHTQLVTAWEKLQEADSEVTYAAALAFLLSHPQLVPTEWFGQIVQLGPTPWKRGKGRPRKTIRQEEIEWEYFGRHMGGIISQPPRPAESINRIVADHMSKGLTITVEAARKMYEAARESYAAKPYAISGIIVTDREGNN